MSVVSSDFPLAYLVTFRTYGSWLHGDERGSVDQRHSRPGSELAPANQHRLEAVTHRMKHTPHLLNADRRQSVHRTLHEVAQHRGWSLYAINVRTNHVHAVVAAGIVPERVMSDFKSWATRRLREASLVPDGVKLWSRHGSTRYLWNETAVDQACHYVNERQGTDLEG